MGSSLADDTLGDKLVRFVIGAVVGGFVAFAGYGRGLADVEAYVRHIGVWAAATGALAALFGNRFLELFVESRTSWTPFRNNTWDNTGYQTRSPQVNTAADRVMCFVFGAAAGGGLALIEGRGPAGVPWSDAIVPALIGGTLCALLGYRFTRFFR
jgi:hypothetical protein